MKKLSFTLEKKEVYATLFGVALAAPVKGTAEIINSLETLKAFKSIGIIDEKDTSEPKMFYTIDKDCILELEDSYFTWLKARFEELSFQNSVKIEVLAEVAELLKNPK